MFPKIQNPNPFFVPPIASPSFLADPHAKGEVGLSSGALKDTLGIGR